MVSFRKRILFPAVLFLSFLLWGVRGNAQEVKKVGTTAAAFLRIPVGARGIAMGSAFVSIADDASAMFWNPGALGRLAHTSVYADHSSWLPGLDFNFIGVVVPVRGIGIFGISLTALVTEDMLVTTPEHPSGTGETFGAGSYAAGIAFGRNLTDRFSIGANVKIIRETIYHSSALGAAFDIGTLFTTPFAGIRLGVSISNMGTKMRMDGEDLNVQVDIAPDQQGNNQSVVGRLRTDAFQLPLIMRVGISWDIIKTGGQQVTLAVDGNNPNDNMQSVDAGIEVGLFRKTVVLLAGYNDLFLEEGEKGFTAGLGLNLEFKKTLGIAFGYAYQNLSHLTDVSRITLALVF